MFNVILNPDLFCLAPSAPRSLAISQVTANNVTLEWAPPLSIPGLLKEYRLVTELLDTKCEPDVPILDEEPPSGCVESSVTVSVNASEEGPRVTVHPLAKYRHYRFKVAAVTNAGVGEYTEWKYARTLAGSKNTILTTSYFLMTVESMELMSEAGMEKKNGCVCLSVRPRCCST